MCHSTHPRCESCNARTPRHRCHCPSKIGATNTIVAQQHQNQSNTLPAYSSLGAQTASPLHGWVMQPVTPRQCGARSCGHGCNQERRCRGPVRMLVGYLLQKHQEKKFREVETPGSGAAFEASQQERGVVEIGHEKGEEKWAEHEKSGEVKVVAESVSGMSL